MGLPAWAESNVHRRSDQHRSQPATQLQFRDQTTGLAIDLPRADKWRPMWGWMCLGCGDPDHDLGSSHSQPVAQPPLPIQPRQRPLLAVSITPRQFRPTTIHLGPHMSMGCPASVTHLLPDPQLTLSKELRVRSNQRWGRCLPLQAPQCPSPSPSGTPRRPLRMRPRSPKHPPPGSVSLPRVRRTA